LIEARGAVTQENSDRLYRAGTGEPVVLLHGITMTWRSWSPVLADLVSRYEVVAPTLAGHDGGPPFTGELTIESAADWLACYLDELGIETAHFVGSSMGGSVAIELAKRGRARSVVAFSPPCGWKPGPGSAPDHVARVISRSRAVIRVTAAHSEQVLRSAHFRQVALRDVMRHGHLVPPADAVQLTRSMLACDVADDAVRMLRAGHATLVDLDRVAAPVLLAWAEHDRIVPAKTCSARFREQIPNVEYRLLRGVGHLPTWDDHHLVASTIIDWISSTQRQSESAEQGDR
jgi:pimeloyl-ACP methyl ester carboxylesterase